MTRPYWHYQDPLEPSLQAQVSSDLLMEHVRTIGAWERESGSPGEAQAYDYIERALKSYGLEVIYTTGDRFTHDLALPLPPLAGLQPARDLGALDPATDAFKFRVAALVRERNRVVHALDEAADVIDDLLRRKEMC